MQDEKQLKEDIANLQKDINAYKALKAINKSDEFNAFFDLILKTVTQKMMWAFTTDSVKTLEDFYKLKGEITAYLYPIQEVRSSKAAEEALLNQLQEYYKNPYEQ